VCKIKLLYKAINHKIRSITQVRVVFVVSKLVLCNEQYNLEINKTIENKLLETFGLLYPNSLDMSKTDQVYHWLIGH